MNKTKMRVVLEYPNGTTVVLSAREISDDFLGAVDRTWLSNTVQRTFRDVQELALQALLDRKSRLKNAARVQLTDQTTDVPSEPSEETHPAD